TDQQGRFAITGLRPGVYNLLFEKAPGRPTSTARAVEGLRVRAGQSVAALVKMVEGRSLRGVVIDYATGHTVAGILVAASDRPVHGQGPRSSPARLTKMGDSRSMSLPASSPSP